MTALLPTFTGAPAVNRVYHTDALSLLAALPDNSVDLVVTSPPYDNLRTYKGYTFDFQPIARETYRVMKPGGVVVWVVGDATINGSETLTSMRQALYFVDVCGFNAWDTMIWDKQSGLPHQPYIRYCQTFEYMLVFSKGVAKTANIPTYPKLEGKRKRSRRNPDGTMRRDISGVGGGALPNIWQMNIGFNSTDDAFTFEPPATFPEELAERHILTWSNAGDVVLDYFGGSGTTAKMARNLGRNYITCDISLDYCEIARKRLALPYTPLLFTDSELAG